MVLCTLDNITKITKCLGLASVPQECFQKLSVDSLGFGSLAGFGSLLLKLARDTNNQYLGSNLIEEALVKQWIEYSVCIANYSDSVIVAQQIFKELNSHLSSRTYIIGNKSTLADVVLYNLLNDAVKNLSYQEKEQYIHLSRWFNNLQQNNPLGKRSPPVNFSRSLLYN